MGWISVKDRLPENLEKVLFLWVYDEILKNLSVGYMADGEWSIYLPYTSFDLNGEYIEVTHWMPLPDCPKDKE